MEPLYYTLETENIGSYIDNNMKIKEPNLNSYFPKFSETEKKMAGKF